MQHALCWLCFVPKLRILITPTKPQERHRTLSIVIWIFTFVRASECGWMVCYWLFTHKSNTQIKMSESKFLHDWHSRTIVTSGYWKVYVNIDLIQQIRLVGSVLDVNMQREVWKERQAKRCSFDRGIFEDSTTVVDFSSMCQWKVFCRLLRSQMISKSTVSTSNYFS